MVNATVDNAVVSIQLKSQSTTVPSNETWVVNISVGQAGGGSAELSINGNPIARTSGSSGSPRIPQLEITLTGGDTIAETSGFGAHLSIQGFVVDS